MSCSQSAHGSASSGRPVSLREDPGVSVFASSACRICQKLANEPDSYIQELNTTEDLLYPKRERSLLSRTPRLGAEAVSIRKPRPLIQGSGVPTNRKDDFARPMTPTYLFYRGAAHSHEKSLLSNALESISTALLAALL